MILSQDLGVFDPKWRGWIVRDGELISPEDWRIGVSEVRTVPILHQQVSAWRTETMKLRHDLELGLQEQPLPSQWEADTCLLKLKKV